jgi:ankyrin repeat protein
MRSKARLRAAYGLAVVAALSVAIVSAAPADTRLVEAAKKADVAAVRALLKAGADVNGPGGDGATALHWAAYHDDLDSVDLLLKAGANVNAADDLGVTSLWLACREAKAAVVDRLLKAGADPNKSLASGETPTMAAAYVGNEEAVKLLAARGAAVDAREKSREQTALMWAAAQRHPDIVKLLIELGADIHARSKVWPSLVNLGSGLNAASLNAAAGSDDYDPSGVTEILQGGYTPLMFAAQQGDAVSARILIAAGAKVNDSAPTGTTPLVIAAHSGQGAFAQFILDHGADPNAMGAGYSALHAAILRRDAPLVKALMAHGADLNVPVSKATPARRVSADYAIGVSLIDATPLWLAARFAEADVMKALADAGANPAFVMKDGTTMAMAPMLVRPGATSGDQSAGPPITESLMLEAIKAATSLGVPLDAANGVGNTALHAAASRGFSAIAQFLVESGARMDARNKRGQTPLAVATAAGRKTTVETLKKLGAPE